MRYPRSYGGKYELGQLHSAAAIASEMRRESVLSKRTTSSSVNKSASSAGKCFKVAEWFTLSQVMLKILELVSLLQTPQLLGFFYNFLYPI